jgi:hypothetical protein
MPSYASVAVDAELAEVGSCCPQKLPIASHRTLFGGFYTLRCTPKLEKVLDPGSRNDMQVILLNVYYIL